MIFIQIISTCSSLIAGSRALH